MLLVRKAVCVGGCMCSRGALSVRVPSCTVQCIYAVANGLLSRVVISQHASLAQGGIRSPIGHVTLLLHGENAYSIMSLLAKQIMMLLLACLNQLMHLQLAFKAAGRGRLPCKYRLVKVTLRYMLHSTGSGNPIRSQREAHWGRAMITHVCTSNHVLCIGGRPQRLTQPTLLRIKSVSAGQ
jgi:hypothetical protein